MIAIDRHPPRGHVLVFAWLLPVIVAAAGVQRWHAGAIVGARVFWTIAVLLTVVALAGPTSRRRLYVGWMVATYPLAWLVSHTILVAAYFLVATPTALVLRMIGRDPMQRRFDRDAASYWMPREAERPPARYFRQF